MSYIKTFSAEKMIEPIGYPPDMQLLATETVLKQAEMIANELVN
jgi:type I restriction enzyme, R subunit